MLMRVIPLSLTEQHAVTRKKGWISSFGESTQQSQSCVVYGSLKVQSEQINCKQRYCCISLRVTHDFDSYDHVITHTSSDKPDDAAGGILADAMGVGKTLTMIASIVSSLEKASQFAAVQEPNTSLARDSETSQIHSVSSTLILVPSARERPTTYGQK